MMKDIKNMISNGLPTLATCAGLILLSEHIADDDTVHIGTLPVTIKRNAYGRQLSSFVTNADAAKYNNQIGLSFHPELTGDTRIHEYFLSTIK